MRGAALLAVLALGPNVAIAGQPVGGALEGWALSVVDGDTFVLLDDSGGKHAVRLQGIDAPELKQPQGRESKRALVKKIFRKRVVVRWSVKDSDGRLLGALAIKGSDVNREMVAEGWAWRLGSPPPSDELMVAEEAATAAKLGLWADARPIAPWEWREEEAPPAVPALLTEAARGAQRGKPRLYVSQPFYPPPPEGSAPWSPPGGILLSPTADAVYVTRTGAKYHRGGCHHLRQSKIPISHADANTLYEPCRVCNPSR